MASAANGGGTKTALASAPVSRRLAVARGLTDKRLSTWGHREATHDSGQGVSADAEDAGRSAGATAIDCVASPYPEVVRNG